MERIPPKLYPALANEIAGWRQENLITADLANALMARYPAGAHRTNTIALLTIIGAVLVGLGTLLYIGANWQVLATVWKLLIIVTAVVSAHLAGWYFKFEPGDRPKLGTAMLILGSLFYGGAIWLVAQMFNLDVYFPNGLMLWFAGAAASAVVTRSSQVGILASVILGWWTIDSHNWFFNGNADPNAGYAVVLSTLVGVSLACYLRSRAMTWITLLTASLWIVTASGTHNSGLLFWGFALFGAYLWTRSHWQIGSSPFKYVGICSAMTAIIALTCDRSATVDQLQAVNYAGLLAGAAAIHIFLLAKFPQYRNEALSSLLLLAYFLFFSSCPIEIGRVVAFNFMALASIVGLAFAGTKNLQSQGIVNTAIVFSIIYIFCRYFDLFFSMMDRSLFFIVGGVILMAIGTLAEGSRRRLVGSMSQ